MSPLKAVNPFISQKRMVISRREPWASANSGRSIAFAAAQLRQRWIGNLWICALLDITQRREVEVAIDFVGFTIGDVFVEVTAPTTPRNTATCPISGLWSDAPGSAMGEIRGSGRGPR